MLTRMFKYLFIVCVAFAALVLVLNFTYSKDIELPDTASGKHVLVNGVKLRVHQVGTGPDVLFVHGSIGSLEDFETVLPLLKGYRVTLFDRIGHGYSDMPAESANIASNAKYTAALIKTLQLKNVIVVGHSYGGSVALKMAIEQTPNIKALVLIAPASKPDETRAIEHLFENKFYGLGLLRILRPFIAEDMLRDGLLNSLKPNLENVPDNFVETRLSLWNNSGTLYTRTQQTAVVTNELSDMQSQYASIKLPTTILLGEEETHEDIYVGSQELSVAIPGAQLRLITGAGHYLQYKDPEAVSTAIKQIK